MYPAGSRLDWCAAWRATVCGELKRFLFIGLFGVAVAAAALALHFYSSDTPTQEKGVAGLRPVAPAASGRVARNSGIPVPLPPPVAAYRSGKFAPKAESKSVAQPAQPEMPSASAAITPEFDVVRVNPAGDAVIAGHAAPGATVTIYDGDNLSGSVVADDRGDWVYLPTKPLPSGKRELGLSARNANGEETRSKSVVVLMVPDRAAKPTPAAPESKPAEALAVLVSRDGSTPSRVLQKPADPPGVGSRNLSIGIIDYDEKGNVKIGGEGKPGAKVQVYVDNRLVGRSAVGSKGKWTVGPEQKIDPGVHKLRVDATRKGKVVARVEIPFSRADPALAAMDEALVVVQPGNSLWRIARRTLGNGIRYVEIYHANQSQIVDPDLIYPGQVFSLPGTN